MSRPAVRSLGMGDEYHPGVDPGVDDFPLAKGELGQKSGGGGVPAFPGERGTGGRKGEGDVVGISQRQAGAGVRELFGVVREALAAGEEVVGLLAVSRG